MSLVTVTPVSAPPVIAPVLPTLPTVVPLMTPDPAFESSTAVIDPVSVPPTVTSVIVPAPCATIVPAISLVTVTPVSAPPVIVPVLPTLPTVVPLMTPDPAFEILQTGHVFKCGDGA